METPVLAWGPADLAAERPTARTDSGFASATLLESVMRAHNQRLYRLALSFVGNPEDAEDVLQESYCRAFEKRASFAGASGLGAWLSSIVRNHAIDCLRARRSRRSVFTLEADLPVTTGDSPSPIDRVPAPGAFGNPELAVENGEVRAALENAILSLPLPFRAVFMLREVEGLSLQQTATLLEIPVATVKTRAHRARLLLRAELGTVMPGELRQAFEFLRERCDRMVSRVLKRLGLL